ncbi:hypothetical protein SEA_LUMOS_44 [Mycobacterium phage Lumos]|nr:hypothetical protein J4T93_gp044 [Mycobacterium phage Lumos]ALA06560.1 hypothetical protein SEA_LUMOS_44 [Mycobacterium phage Lumos]
MAQLSCELNCGASYTEEYQLHLHHYASEKGILPTCGKGRERKARNAERGNQVA